MLIKNNKDKVDVRISIRNSKDNAYNTKVILSFSPNINYVKAEVSRDISTVLLVHFLCANLCFLLLFALFALSV